MTTPGSGRDRAIEAAAEAMEDAALRWIGRDLGTVHRNDIAAAALAAAVPVLLNDLADSIEADRLTDNTGSPEDVGYNDAIDDALAHVRAAAAGWGEA